MEAVDGVLIGDDGEPVVENDGSCEGQVDSHELYVPMRLEEL